MGEINNPNQIVLVTSRYNKKDNIIALTWWAKTSFQPNLYLISVAKTRYSYELIKKSKCFVINFMPYELKDKILFCGTKSGRDLDKFKDTVLNKLESEKINCSVIREALAYLECKVVNEIETGDHMVFIGEVVNAKLNKQGKRAFQLDRSEFTTTVD
ncbi:MAG: flavin reductase family protein [Nanoarchaeota archaeon]|nr:flavin reductase family protein [Nanoarchaeota archaeon]